MQQNKTQLDTTQQTQLNGTKPREVQENIPKCDTTRRNKTPRSATKHEIINHNKTRQSTIKRSKTQRNTIYFYNFNSKHLLFARCCSGVLER